MNELLAGRELDALVAERVMGEARPIFTHGTAALEKALVGAWIVSPGGAWIETCEYDGGDYPHWVPKPYSTDIAAAWLVVEKIEEQWTGRVRVSVIFEMGRYECAIVALTGHGLRGRAYADTAPLAICRAALLALLP